MTIIPTKLSQDNIVEIRSFFPENNELIERYSNMMCSSISDYIWKILTLSRFSVYSSKMNQQLIEENKGYIQTCIDRARPIHIVLAGLPGKCANKSKVFHRNPDLGEVAMLLQIELINRIISIKYKPGIKVTFLSDYVGLWYSFFPEYADINLYVDTMRRWISSLAIPINIVFVTEVLPQIEMVLDQFRKEVRTYDTLKSLIHSYIPDEQMYNSMRDNMNQIKAIEYYRSVLGVNPTEEEIVKTSCKLYQLFWNYWSSMHAVKNHFGSVIYGSPVAYHPETRLCMRLQCSSSRVAPWNGCGLVDHNKVYSVDERLCIMKQYFPIIGPNNYFWGYSKQQRNSMISI